MAQPFSTFFRLAALILLLAPAAAAHAQGGPPFRTDDPETPGNKHWEINFGFIGDRNPAAGAYQVPDFDINYGLGDRIQLKYEIPIAIEETRPQPGAPGQVIGGLGESLLGAFGHGTPDTPEPGGEEPKVTFSMSTYPQLFLDNPTRAVPRGLVAPGPDFYLPIEANGRIGPIRYDAEIGYNFGNHALPQSWGRGVILGHEFSDSTEAYVELYDAQDANRIRAGQGVGQFATGESKQRQTTLGLGGRQSLNHSKTLNLLLMAGRAFQTISAGNSQPSWIAYVGLQVLLGPKEPETPQVEQKKPDESKP